MKTKNSTVLNASSIQSRLGLCAAALAGTAAVIPSAEAVVVTFNVNATVPQTFQGLYINFVTGTITGTPTGNLGWDFNPYAAASGMFAIYWSASTINAGVSTGPGSMTYADLAIGTVVGPSSSFHRTNGVGTSPNYTTAGTHILGFRFLNEATGMTNYGYATISTGSGTGFPVTIHSWSFENNGGSITVVPEPSTTAMLTAAALVLGALGLRKWRRQQAA